MNINYEGDTLNNKNKIKYDSEYISYVANGDSAAVFIVRDIVKSIDTSGMWIDVISTSGYKTDYMFPIKLSQSYPWRI